MRLAEFTSAQDQLALWKLISDTVWSSINAQATQQAKAAAQQKRVMKPKTRVSNKVKIPKPAPPKPFPKPRPLITSKNRAAATNQTSAVVDQKRLPNQPTAKSTNLNSAGAGQATMTRGIASDDTSFKTSPIN